MTSRRKKVCEPKMTALLFARLYMESWAAGHTLRQFAERVGLSPSGARGRLYFYRRNGWTPPKLRPDIRGRRGNGRDLDIKSMNAIVAEVVVGPERVVVTQCNGSPVTAG